MKRVLSVLVVMALLCMPVSAQSAFTYVTDYDYALIRSGGPQGAFVYGAYENNGQNYMIGLLTEEGEQSRIAWTAQDWNALFEPSAWSMTVHDDASALCPYASSHMEETLCPYLDVSLVTLTHTQTGLALENYYMQNPKKHLGSASSIHVCFGNYGFASPETLKWDGDSTLMALCDDSGNWGVYDTATQTMLTPFMYSDMSAVYGDYAKVSNGTAWGRLDVTGKTDTVYMYADENAFSIKEELREVADGQWRVFNADNEPISATYQASVQELSYMPYTHTVLKTASDGTKTMLDLAGDTVASFETTQQVLYLDRACYAIEQYNASGAVVGVALATVSGVPTPEDTVVAGDINFNGIVDTSDARLLLRQAVDLEVFTARQMLAADVLGDGSVTTADARALLKTIVMSS